MSQVIQDLKAQFPTASGVEKIAMARKIIEERAWNKALSDADNDLYKAAHLYFKAHLQGKIVKAKVDDSYIDVHLTGSGWKEMKRGMKSDELKTKLVRSVEDIISNGRYDGRTEAHKDRKDGYVAFHFFIKDVELDDLTITAGVNVGERKDGMFEYTAYGLGYEGLPNWHKKALFDSCGTEPQTNKALESGRPTLDSIIDLDADDDNDRFIFDSYAKAMKHSIKKSKKQANGLIFTTLGNNQRRLYPQLSAAWYEEGEDENRAKFIADWQEETRRMLLENPKLELIGDGGVIVDRETVLNPEKQSNEIEVINLFVLKVMDKNGNRHPELEDFNDMSQQPVFDDVTQPTVTISQLKSQFPTANGMGKITLARQILHLRSLKNAANTHALLESNRPATRNENGNVQNSLFNDGGTNREGAGRTGQQISPIGNGQQSDIGLPTSSPIASGTGSDTGMDKRNGELGLTARSADDSGSTESSRFGILDDRLTNPTIETDVRATQKLERDTKARLQLEAENLDSVFNNEDSIRADLPYLLPEQQDDIVKIEKRLADANGMMITNGTGTGKTFTALGAIKRFAKQGKDSILIVVPGDKIAQDFVDSAKNLHLSIKKLESIQDNGGSGIGITTYANFYQNESLMRREWDLVVFDEAHKINSNQAGDDTRAVNMMRTITNHKKGIYWKALKLAEQETGLNHDDLMAEQRKYIDGQPEYAEISSKLALLSQKRQGFEDKLAGKQRPFTDEQLEDFAEKRKRDSTALSRLHLGIGVDSVIRELEKEKKKYLNHWNYEQKAAEIDAKIQKERDRDQKKRDDYDALKQLIAQEDADRARIKAEAENNAKPAHKSKVIFLSATPFAYEKSIDYAEGYLFDYAEGGDGYNSGGGYERFMMQHFGYTMRYNKLTQPDAGVNKGVMQRQFNQFLKEQGALSGRALKVEADYSREFIVLKNKIGQQLDDAIDVLSKEFSSLHSYIANTSFNHLNKLMLLEAIKAMALVPRIKKHQALNRKVVLFHSFKKGYSENPFYLDTKHKRWNELDDKQRNEIKAQYDRFAGKYPQFFNLNLDDLESPINTFKKAFGGDLMIYNGDIPKKQILQHANDFNDDDKSKDIILMQVDKGKEGVSLHDTTGKKTRVLINLGLPTKPTDSIQIEGRIYRTGQVSNAIFEYISTGTQFEKRVFSEVIAERSSTAENLALGNEARDLLSAFTEGYLNATDAEPSENQGIGGKQYAAAAEISPFEKAKSDYFATQKANKYTKAKGVDYFPTPEPIGLKMVELANIGAGESALEPSAGHGAIARYFPENAKNTFIEPSSELTGDLALRTAGSGEVKQETFENLSVVNKYNAIVMNPPFGSGGKTAVEHLAKATKHLRDGGRIVALIPKGGNATKLFSTFMATAAKNDIYLTAEIFLPSVAFERAGTAVATQIVVLDRIDDPAQAEQREHARRYDYRLIEDVEKLFEKLQTQLSVLPRAMALAEKETTKAK
jgi:hypothetical protein